MLTRQNRPHAVNQIEAQPDQSLSLQPAHGLTGAGLSAAVSAPEDYSRGNGVPVEKRTSIVLTDADVPTEAEFEAAVAWTQAEQRWLSRQARKQARAVGTSKYVPHQGTRERARRLAR